MKVRLFTGYSAWFHKSRLSAVPVFAVDVESLAGPGRDGGVVPRNDLGIFLDYIFANFAIVLLYVRIPTNLALSINGHWSSETTES
eukprot:gene20057-biopygen6484